MAKIEKLFTYSYRLETIEKSKSVIFVKERYEMLFENVQRLNDRIETANEEFEKLQKENKMLKNKLEGYKHIQATNNRLLNIIEKTIAKEGK